MDLYDVVVAKALSGGSGGGGGNFSTATVRFTNTNPVGTLYLKETHIIDEDGHLISQYSVSSSEDVTFILANGECECILDCDDSHPIVVTGAILENYGVLTIEGDGTVSAHGWGDA